jgi:hypothetical protein
LEGHSEELDESRMSPVIPYINDASTSSQNIYKTELSVNKKSSSKKKTYDKKYACLFCLKKFAKLPQHFFFNS